MPVRGGVNQILARPIAGILADLRKEGIPIRLSKRAVQDRVRGPDEVAQSQIRDSKARRIAAYANESLSEDPERSLILSVLAVETTYRFNQPPVEEAAESLHRALVASENGDELPKLQHSAEVTAVSYSPDGRKIAAASLDGTAKIVGCRQWARAFYRRNSRQETCEREIPFRWKTVDYRQF
jgi:WD40 repeat protein